MESNFALFEVNVAGIEIFLNSDGGCIYQLCILKKSKSKLITVKTENELTEFKVLIQSIEKKNPLILSLNGKGIIHKKTTKTNDTGFESLLHKILPSGKVEDFYVQTFETATGDYITSIARRNLIEPIISEFTNAGFSVTGFTLGPFNIQSVLPLLPSMDKNSYFKIGGYQIEIKNDSIEDYVALSPTQDNEVDVPAGLVIKPEQLVSYASALSYFSPVEKMVANDSSFSRNAEEFRSELKFKKTAVYLLGFFFLALLINFLIFSTLSDKVKSKSAQFALVSSTVNRADSLQRQIEERSAFLAKTGLSDPSRASYYADQIAKDLPSSILLTGININPLKKNDDAKKIEFTGKQILVYGKAQYALDVNEWIKLLRNNNWVSAIALQNYNQKQGNDPGEFIVQITLK